MEIFDSMIYSHYMTQLSQSLPSWSLMIDLRCLTVDKHCFDWIVADDLNARLVGIGESCLPLYFRVVILSFAAKFVDVLYVLVGYHYEVLVKFGPRIVELLMFADAGLKIAEWT